MSKNIQNLFRFALVFIVIVIGNYVIVAQSDIVNGDWKAEYVTKQADKIHLLFSRKIEKGHYQTGSNYDLKDLQGLSVNQINASDERVKFTLVREAGNIECEGKFTNGKGAGTYRFTPNQSFIDEMKSRGFDFEKPRNSDDNDIENRLFAAATLNITTALADDLLSANFGKLDVDDLFKAAIFKIDSKFMSEMKASGFPNLTMEDLVKARIFKIDAEYVRGLSAVGFNDEPFESLVKARIFKITPDFVTEIRSEGFTNLSIEDYVKMKIFKIDGEFIREARADGVTMEVEKLVQKRIGVWRK